MKSNGQSIWETANIQNKNVFKNRGAHKTKKKPVGKNYSYPRMHF